MQKSIIIRFIGVLCLLMVGLTLLAQNDNYIYFDKNTATLDPPPSKPVPPKYRDNPDAWEAERVQIATQMKAFKRQKERDVYSLIDKLHQCFRLISDPTRDSEVKASSRRVANRLFKTPEGAGNDQARYFGFVFSENQFTESYTTLDKYLEGLINNFQNDRQTSICWATPTFIEDDSKRVDTLNATVSTKITKLNPNDSIQRYYRLYRLELPVRERIAVKDANGGFTKSPPREICKKIVCELRCYERYDSVEAIPEEDRFYWRIALAEVEKLPDNKLCKGLNEVDCLIPEDAIALDSIFPDGSKIDTTTKVSDCVWVVKKWSYLVPGVGFKYLGFQDEKKKPAWPITAIWAGSGLFAGYSKFRSIVAYNNHKKSTILKIRDDEYDEAEKWHKRFLISGGISAATWLLTDLVIFLKDRKSYRSCVKTREENLKSKSSYHLSPNLFVAPVTTSIGVRFAIEPKN
jgi:hypothetical protein